jgi:ribosomal protein S18 acetylase RimI-like enzyme
MVTIRRGTEADHEAAIAVYLAANELRRGAETPQSHVERVRVSMQRPGAFLFIADDGGVCTGMTLAMQSRSDHGAGPPIPGVCHLGMVFVAPDRWGEGIGHALLGAVLAEAAARDYHLVQLWTHANNTRAQRLYEHRGFTRTGDEHDNDLGELIVQYEIAVG